MKHWIRRVAVNWIAIVAALCLADSWAWLVPLAIVVIGTRQFALAVLLHDAVHRNGAGDAVGNWFCAYPLLTDVASLRAFHFAHHRYLGTKCDPELAIWSQFPQRWEATVNKRRLFWRDLCGLGLTELAATREKVASYGRRPWTPFVVHACAVVAAVASGQWLVLLLWYLAFGTVFWAAFRARAWTEHHGVVGNTHRQSRPALWRRLTYLPESTWKHWEHHRWPGVPVWKL